MRNRDNRIVSGEKLNMLEKFNTEVNVLDSQRLLFTSVSQNSCSMPESFLILTF